MGCSFRPFRREPVGGLMSKGDLINLRDGLMLEIKHVRLALERMEGRIAAVEAQCGAAAVEGDDIPTIARRVHRRR